MKPKRAITFQWGGPSTGSGAHGNSWTCQHPDLTGLVVTEYTDENQALKLQASTRCSREDALSAIVGSLFRIDFASKDELAGVVLALLKAHQEAIAKSPVAPEQLDFIARQVRDNRDQAKALRELCWANRSQLRQLRVTARALGIEELAMPSYDASDTDKLIKEIDAFQLDFAEKNDPPFFSEACLYELVGKDQARSVLALMNRIKEVLDPIAAAEH